MLAWMAESAEAAGRAKAPTWPNSCVNAAPPPQLVSVAIEVPAELYRLSCGAASTPVTPKDPRVGPTPRTTMVLEPVPLVTKPAMMALAPVPTLPRIERLMSLELAATTLPWVPVKVTGVPPAG